MVCFVLRQTLPAVSGNRTGIVFEDDGDSSAYAYTSSSSSPNTTTAPIGLVTSLSITDQPAAATIGVLGGGSAAAVVKLRFELVTNTNTTTTTETPPPPTERQHRFVFLGVDATPSAFLCDGKPASTVAGASATVVSGAAAVAAATGNYACSGSPTNDDADDDTKMHKSHDTDVTALVVTCGSWPIAWSGARTVELALPAAQTPNHNAIAMARSVEA